MKRLLGALRRADETYQMIDQDDHLAVGVSGGKDSMALLFALAQYQKFAKKQFTLHALTIKIGDPFDTAPIKSLCESLAIPYTVQETNIMDTLVADENPCALCARLRRGILLRMAKDTGCNKLALAHHRDDAMETLLMSVLHEGRLHTFQPVSHMERMGIQVIRPLIDAPESMLAACCEKQRLPIVKNPCPVDGHTTRQQMKDLLQAVTQKYPDAKERLSAALARDYYTKTEDTACPNS